MHDEKIFDLVLQLDLTNTCLNFGKMRYDKKNNAGIFCLVASEAI